jgi:drug/metabolite transporter (DMT)-like permease
MSETSSILILILATVVLAIYTLVGIRLWLGKKEKIQNPWIQFGLGWVVVVFAIFAPLLLLAYLMNDIKLVKNMTPNERSLVLFVWCIPAGIYVIMYLIRKSKSEKK